MNYIIPHEKAVGDIRMSRGDDYGRAEEARAAISGARTMVERLDLDGSIQPDVWSTVQRPHTPDPRRRFDLLWREEMADALGRHFGGAAVPPGKLTRPAMTAIAIEHMTGRELRRAVCAQLRDRVFPRADERASLTIEARP